MCNFKFSFLARWFFSYGVGTTEIEQKVANARARANRFQRPINWFYPFAVFLVEWFMPLFVLHQWQRASRLSSDNFEIFQERLHHHRFLWPRLLFMLVRLPLWDLVYADQKPTAKSPHPLTDVVKSKPSDDEYDVVVIGSGAGGAPIAYKMAQKGFKTLVIESGNIVTPQTTSFVVENYFYRQGMTLSTKGGLILSLAGNTVGGTTSINSGTSLRPTQAQLKIWDGFLKTDFASGVLDSYFTEVEEVIGVTIPPRELLGASAHLIAEGLAKMGRSGDYVLPRNAPDCKGSGRCCFGCPTGAKHSTDLSFLPRAVQYGCEIVSGARVESIVEEKNTVLIFACRDGKKFCVAAKKLVIAAGAFGTVQLIRKNQLGTRWRAAGSLFRTHPATKVFAYFKNPVHGEKGVPQGLGYATPELPRIVFEGVFTPRSAAAPLVQLTGARQRFWLDNYDHVASFAFLLVDREQGKVRFVGNQPVIRLKLSDEDVVEMVRALKLCGEIFFYAGAQRVLLPLVGVKNEFLSLTELNALKPESITGTQILTSGFHPQGTASMGVVVDNNLRVQGLNHVYVCDASVLPASPGVNPQITIMGLSLRLADYLASDLA